MKYPQPPISFIPPLLKVQVALAFPSLTMASRTVSLIAYRNAATQRAHFAIFIPSAANQDLGTLIHVIGAPMAGYQLEFKRNYSLVLTQQLTRGT